MKGSVGRNTLILTFVRVITVFSSLLIMMFLSRATTLEEYGTYNQIILVITLATSLFMLGLPNSINYFLSKVENKKEKQQFLMTYFSLTILLSVLVGVTLIGSSHYIEQYFQNKSIGYYLPVLFILPWAKITIMSIENVLIVVERIQQLQTFKIIHSLSLVFVAIMSYVLKLDLSDFFLFYLIVEIIHSILVYIFIFQITSSFKLSINRALVKNIFKFSIPIGLASIVGTLNIQLDKLIIGRYFDTETLAIYFNASKEIPINILAASLTAIIIPKLVKLFKYNNTHVALDLWKYSIIVSYYVISFFVMVFFTFSGDVLMSLYSSKYEAGSSVFKIYSLVLLFRITYFGIILNATGKTKIVLYSSLIALMINVIFNFILIKLIGIEGPALATLFSLASMAFFQLYMSARLLKISMRNIFPWIVLMKISVIVIFVGIIGKTLKILLPLEYIIGSVMESIIISLLLFILYLVVARKDFIKVWKQMNLKGSDL